MDVGSISQNALLGINRGLNQASEASTKLASSEQLNSESSTNDTSKALVDLQQANTQIQISAKVAQTAGDIIGAIIDIRA